MRIEKLAEENAYLMPGYELVHFSEVAFPVWRVNLSVQMLQESDLNVVQQFILKLLEVGVNNIDELVAILGLQPDIIEEAAAILLGNELIKFDPLNKNLNITEKAKPVLQTLKLNVPQTVAFGFYIDGVNGQYCPLENRLIPPEAIKKQGIRAIHHSKYIDKPSEVTISFPKLESFFKRMGQSGYNSLPFGQLLDIIEVEKVWPAYKLMRVLTYVEHSTGDYRFVVFDRDHRAYEYDVILTSLDREEDLGVLPLEPMDEKVTDFSEKLLGPVFDEAEKNVSDLSKLEKEAQEASEAINSGTLSQKSRDELIKEVKIMRDKIINLNHSTRLLRTYEHRPLLEKSFEITKTRIIIVSPWLSPIAFDDDLIGRMEKALQKNKKVIILYGYPGEMSEKKKRDEKAVLDKLNKIKSKRYGKHLYLENIAITHEKILICDNSFIVVGSFNWLSFRGDSLMGLRLEKSVYTENVQVIMDAIEDIKRLTKIDNSMC